jgi:hypothetical protein
MDLVRVQRAVLQRRGLVADLGHGALGELVRVDDDLAAARHVADVGLERRRVHRDQHVRRVAGREDVVVGEVQLEAGDTRERPGGGPDLRGEVRQRGEVVAERRRLRGEPVTRQLHAVTGITREADDHPVQSADFLVARGPALLADDGLMAAVGLVGLIGRATDLAGH